MINIQIEGEVAIIDVKEREKNYKKVTDLNTLRKTLGITDTVYDSGFLPGMYGTKRIEEGPDIKKVLYIEPPKRRRVTYYHYWLPEYEDSHGYTKEDFEKHGYKQGDMSDDEYEEYLKENWRDLRNEIGNTNGGYHQEEFDVMFPNAVMIARMATDSSRASVTLHTTGFRTFINGDEPLYEFPAPNIYPRRGTICWGANDFNTTLENMQSLQGVLPKFLSSPFNSDLDGGRIDKDTKEHWRDMTKAFEDGKTEEEVLSMYNELFIPAGRRVNTEW